MMKQAFTLIEVVMVMAIVAAVSAVTIISIDYIAPKKVEATARKIIAELRWFRGYVGTQMKNPLPPPDYDSGLALFQRDAVRGDYIEFWDCDDSLAQQNLVRTVYFNNPDHLITNPALPVSLYFMRLDDRRRAIPVSSLSIDIDGEQKISIEDETGYIQYVR